MNYYKDENGELHSIDSADYAHLLPDCCTEISEDEYVELSAPPPPTIEQLAEIARSKRNALIAETDYLLLPDYQITDEKLAAVKVYRQILRDITKQVGFPADIKWPNPI